MNKRVFKEAFIKSLPVMAGYIFLGFGFGVLLRDAGYSPIWALAMSVTIYAGSMQYVGVSLLAGGAGIISVIITTVAVQARHLFYSISMINEFKGAGKKKPYLIFALTDETYSLICDGSYPKGEDKHSYRFLLSLLNQLYWITGCVLGCALGPMLPFNTSGIEFSMTAIFVASFVSQWKSTKNHIPALVGVISSVLCLILFGADNFLIPAMLLITLSLLFLQKPINKKEGEAND